MDFKVTLFIISLFFANNLEDRSVETGYVQLSHDGDQDKPYYKIFFHLPETSIDTIGDYSFIADFEVTAHDYLCIKKIIESEKFVGTSLIRDGTYSFMISHYGVKKTIQTGFLEPIESVFQKIYKALSDTTKKERVKDIFNQTLWRMGGNVSNW